MVASPPAGWLTAKLLIPCSTVLCSALAKRTKPPFGPVFEGVPELLRLFVDFVDRVGQQNED